MWKLYSPFAAVVVAGAGVLGVTGCELIAAVDPALLDQTTSTATSGGGQGGAGQGGAAQGGGGQGGAAQGGGGQGGVADGGGGQGGGCASPDECPGTDTACQTRTCEVGVCGFSFEQAGTPTAAQTAGDCTTNVCDGQGGLTTEDDDLDIFDDANGCTVDTCDAGVVVNTPDMPGTVCSDNGGALCDGAGACVECLDNPDCMSGVCQANTCVAAACIDTVKNGDETDVDCGGSCGPCADGLACAIDADCESAVCASNLCAAPLCTDVVENGNETDVDCGGDVCSPCGPGLGCSIDSDCVGGSCSGSTCLPTCTDLVANANETDVDCGGPACSPCPDGQTCAVGADCESGVCNAGVCDPPSCNDNVKNGSESDADCGGSCPPCGTNQTCGGPADCASGVCTNGQCVAATCSDLVENGAETDIDCGGPDCGDCGAGQGCGVPGDCQSGVCTGGICATASCGDGVVNATDVCDDGNTASGDGCNAGCAVEAGYTCNGTPSVCVTTCSDGIVAGTEVCDDGNAMNGDGCTSTCTVQTGFTCSGAPSVCAAICGDGLTLGAETCDDGNTANGDGCTSTCTVQTGFTCSGSPSVCSAICGDGQLLGAEVCDDGNVVNGDCCSSTCQIEPNCEIEQNGTAATANGPVPLATVYKGKITPIGDQDFYSFVVPTVSDVKIELFDGNGPSTCVTIDPEVRLVAPNGSTQLVIDDDDGVALCPLIDPALDPGARHLAPGTYYIQAFDHLNNQTIGLYTFRYTFTAVCGNAVTEGFEECDGGALCDANCDRVPVCGDGFIDAPETCDDSNMTSGDLCSATCQLELTSEVEPNGTCAQATGPAVLPELYSGAITPIAEQDFYSFTLTTTADVKIETFDQNGPGSCVSIDTEIQLFSPACAALGPVKDQGGIANCSKLDPAIDTQVRHLLPGTYAVRVNDFGNNSLIPGYRVKIETTTTCGNAIKEGFEECDGGPLCDANCDRVPVCGDGFIDAPETCDDSNMADGDLCSSSCQLEVASEVEPNGTCAEATGPAALPELYGGAITPIGDLDFYSFTLPATADVKIETFDQNGPGTCVATDTEIQLFSPACAALGPAKDQGAIGNCSKLDPAIDAQVRHLPAGTYAVRVNEFGNNAALAGYRVKIELTALCGNSIKEGFEECDGGALCDANCDRIPVCGDFFIDAPETCDDGNTADGDGCSSACAWEQVAEIEPNGTTAAADATGIVIAGSTNILGAITPDLDLDLFKVDLAAPQTVRFEVFDSSGIDCIGMAAMRLRLLNSVGVQLKQDAPDTVASGISVCPALAVDLAAGTYYIQADKTSAGTIAAYFLAVRFEANAGNEVEPNETRPTATPIAGTEVYVFGDHQVGTDIDVYSFTVPQGASVRAETIEGDASKTCESNGIDSFLTLYNNAGATLVTDDDDGRGFCSALDGTGAVPRDSAAHALAAGTYFIEVKRSSSFTAPADIFNYKLIVTIRKP